MAICLTSYAQDDFDAYDPEDGVEGNEGDLVPPDGTTANVPPLEEPPPSPQVNSEPPPSSYSSGGSGSFGGRGSKDELTFRLMNASDPEVAKKYGPQKPIIRKSKYPNHPDKKSQ